MKAIADTMGVARSHLIERTKAGEKPACCRYHKADDAWLLPLIRELVDCRMTYGYRRIGSLLNRRLEEMGKPAVKPQADLPHHASERPAAGSPYRQASQAVS
jgi:putative transposase